MKRVITALIGVPIVFSIIWFLPKEFTAILIVIASLIMLSEYFNMMKLNFIEAFRLSGYALLLFIMSLFYFEVGDLLVYVFIIPLVILMVLVIKDGEYDKLLMSGSYSLIGILYIGLFSGYLILISNYKGGMGASGRELLIYLISVVWMSDTGAFFIGRYFGKHLMTVKLSPKKTVEGLIGGVVFGVAGGMVMRYILHGFVGYIESIFVSILLSLIGQLGDLVESFFKRAMKVKDSGHLLPGHGGVMDRMDALIFSAPFMYLYIYMKTMVMMRN
jgi:phosphatidate cytidylyltransferase